MKKKEKKVPMTLIRIKQYDGKTIYVDKFTNKVVKIPRVAGKIMGKLPQIAIGFLSMAQPMGSTYTPKYTYMAGVGVIKNR